MDFRLKECLEALGQNKVVISDEEKKDTIIEKMLDSFPPTLWGSISWKEVEDKISIKKIDEISFYLDKYSKKNPHAIYIIWHEADLPIVKTNFKNILDNLFDVKEVSCDTWLYSPEDNWVIEFHHDGNITIGFK